MKKKIIIIGIIIILALIAIIFTINLNKKDYIKLGEEIKLYISDEITINDNNKTKIKLIDYTDSRCPKDANCIWSGELSYTFKYKGNKTKEIKLSTVKEKEIEIEDYKISLIDGTEKYASIKIERNK